MPRLSAIIPTFNEGLYLPGLLDGLDEQTSRPGEIIVADASSRDDTVELARAQSTQVVRGGMPAVGRTAGARAATGWLSWTKSSMRSRSNPGQPNDYCPHTFWQRK